MFFPCFHGFVTQAFDNVVQNIFLQFLETKGKVGGQHKFPRVLKGKMYEDWVKYLSTEGLLPETLNAKQET